jgi:hypothetical protein
MIALGTDGVSRGLLIEGVTTGLDMLLFILLHLTALERNALLKDWIVSWLGKETEFLLRQIGLPRVTLILEVTMTSKGFGESLKNQKNLFGLHHQRQRTWL